MDDIPILPPLPPFDNEDKKVVVIVEFMSDVLADWFYKLDKYDREGIVFEAWFAEQLSKLEGDSDKHRLEVIKQKLKCPVCRKGGWQNIKDTRGDEFSYVCEDHLKEINADGGVNKNDRSFGRNM